MPNDPTPPPGRHARRAARLFSPVNQEGDRVLDAGAGESPYRRFLRGRITGVDIRLTPGVNTVATIAALPFPDAAFDGATCFQVLYYASDPRRWILELARVVKPNGWLAVSISRPPALQREQAAHPERPLCDWTLPMWEKVFAESGWMDMTPWRERLLRHAGAYWFGLFRKS